MGRKLEVNRGHGKAAFAEELAKVRIVSRGRSVIEIEVQGEAGRQPANVDARLFSINGIGLDEAVFFVALDPTVYRQPCYGAGSDDLKTFLPDTGRRGTVAEAQLEAVRFVLTIPEDERAEAAERLKAAREAR